MTHLRALQPIICLARAARAWYTPAAMAATTPDILISVQAEELHAANQHEAIELMAAALAPKVGLADPRPLVESAMQREDFEPTYIGRGMALPHARVAGLCHAGVYIAHASAGIPWHAERARLIVFLAVPEEAPELYLHLMSRVVRWRLRLNDAVLDAPDLPAAAWEEELRAALA